LEFVKIGLVKFSLIVMEAIPLMQESCTHPILDQTSTKQWGQEINGDLNWVRTQAWQTILQIMC